MFSDIMFAKHTHTQQICVHENERHVFTLKTPK